MNERQKIYRQYQTLSCLSRKDFRKECEIYLKKAHGELKEGASYLPKEWCDAAEYVAQLCMRLSLYRMEPPTAPEYPTFDTEISERDLSFDNEVEFSPKHSPKSENNHKLGGV